MVTVKEVAKHAGVSLATVSRVINGAENVSPIIRERVQGSIKALGYFPNNAARSLVRRQSGSIAVLLRNLHSPFFTDLIRGFEDGMHQTKRNIFFCSLGKDQSFRDQYIQFLTGGVSDAIILYGSLFTDQPMIEHLQSIHFPLLLIENNFQSMTVNQFLVNNHEGAQSAVNYLVSKGHTRIAHFMGDPNKKVNLDRFTGYTQAMQSNGLLIREDYLCHTMSDSQTAYQLAQDLMRRPPQTRPTAIFCCSDRIAASAIMGITDMGFSVPRDISIIGFDNQRLPHENYTGPRITGICQPLYQMGLDSIKTITDILDGNLSQPVTRLYDTTLMEYETVCPPPDL
ncbi:MAG: LacI family DNA-binding transcriptional regulator [Clostridia bacterium]|nr:LacI family DNA-binding transcriptional regulator [Clostridia bacterium]